MGADASRAYRTNGDPPPVSYFEATPQSAFFDHIKRRERYITPYFNSSPAFTI